MCLYDDIVWDYKKLDLSPESYEYRKLILHIEDFVSDVTDDKEVKDFIESLLLSELTTLESSGVDEDSNDFVKVLKKYV